MELIHRLLAYAAVAATVLGLGWTVLLAVGGRAGGVAFDRFQAAAVSLLIIAAASGLLLIVQGLQPREGLHLLYAVVAIALIPLARSFLGRMSHRRASAVLVATFAVLGAVVYRLFTTG